MGKDSKGSDKDTAKPGATWKPTILTLPKSGKGK
jgi:hypothetical protein